MMDRTFRFRLQGMQSHTIYTERYYSTYEQAFADLKYICDNDKAILKDLNDKQYQAIIEERIELYESATYYTARLETLTKDEQSLNTV